MNWISPRTITGPPAEGKVYLRRHYINEEFWQRIGAGEHLLIVAPRRVGKSSILKDIEKEPAAGYIAIYKNIESDKSTLDLYKRLISMILEQMSARKRVYEWLKKWMESKRITEVSAEGSFKIEENEPNYKEVLLNLIGQLSERQVRVVLMLDEFPDVIQAIAETEGRPAASDVLHTLRSIRDGSFKGFSMVLAGSIGLEHVVIDIERRLTVTNDLREIRVEHFSRKEAHQLVDQLLDGASMQVMTAEREYMFDRVSYLLPYYIQLMVEACDRILHKENRSQLTRDDIDKAYQQVIDVGKNFGDWELRLRKYLNNKEDTEYCIAVLTHCAHQPQTVIQQLYNLSRKFPPATHYNQLITDVLVKDGYLHQNGNHIQFLSPFLQEWWGKRHPLFEIN